jgi:LysM repeat protein
MSVCVVLAWCILPLAAMVGVRVAGPAQANIRTAENISTASRTSTSTTAISAPAILISESVATKTADVTAHPAVRAARWTVRPGDTLSAIATGLRVPGGWQALYAANRSAIGSNPNLIRAGTILALPGASALARYAVAPGDTLSAIAAALGIPGGWQALYAANRSAVGPNPNAIRPGIILATPRQAAHGQAPRAPAQAPAQPRHQASPAPAKPKQAPPVQAKPKQAPPVQARPSHLTAPVTGTAARGMPRWLEDVLLAAGVLAATAFAAEPAAALARRRKGSGPAGSTGPAAAAQPAQRAQRARPARPSRPSRPGLLGRAAKPAKHRASARARDVARQAAEKAKIILADHERLIVTYSVRDHTVYVLTPPGEDPMAVLAAARLVLPEDTYKDLAGHLGVPSAWPAE